MLKIFNKNASGLTFISSLYKMKPNISEFSYGYALTDELINWHGTRVTAAPVFPSLYKEGQAGGGYDVMLDRGGIPLFLQFKLADCMKKANAKEAQRGIFTCPYYKMHLRPRQHSNQHQMLLDLESTGNEVYYVAPAFHEPDGFNEAYLNHTVKDQSIWIKPSAIGPLTDDEEHHISFQIGLAPYFCSEPRIITEATDFVSASVRIEAKIESEGERALSTESLNELANKLFSISRRGYGLSSDQMFTARAELKQRNVFEEIAYYAQAYFNCQFFIVSEG